MYIFTHNKILKLTQCFGVWNYKYKELKLSGFSYSSIRVDTSWNLNVIHVLLLAIHTIFK